MDTAGAALFPMNEPPDLTSTDPTMGRLTLPTLKSCLNRLAREVRRFLLRRPLPAEETPRRLHECMSFPCQWAPQRKQFGEMSIGSLAANQVDMQ